MESHDTTLVAEEEISGPPDLLSLVIEKGATDPEASVIGPNNLTAEQEAELREELRAIAIKGSEMQLENINTKRLALDEEEARIRERLEMVGQIGSNGRSTSLSEEDAFGIGENSLGDREEAVLALVRETNGISTRQISKLLKSSGAFVTNDEKRFKAVQITVGRLQEKDLVESVKSGPWVKCYLYGQAPEDDSQNGSVPSFRKGSAAEVVYSFVTKAPARGRSLKALIEADLDLGGKDPQKIANSLISRKVLVNRGGRGEPHYYLKENDPGENEESSQKTPAKKLASTPSVSARSARAGTKKMMILESIPFNKALRVKEIVAIMAKNSDYNPDGKDADSLKANVYQTIHALANAGELETHSGRGSRKAFYRAGGSAENPFEVEPQDASSVPSRADSNGSSNGSVSVLNLTRLPKFKHGEPKKMVREPEQYDLIVETVIGCAEGRLRFSEIISNRQTILHSLNMHCVNVAEAQFEQRLAQAVARSSLLEVDSEDRDILVVCKNRKKRKSTKPSKPSANREDEDDPDDAGDHDDELDDEDDELPKRATGSVSTFDDGPAQGKSEKPLLYKDSDWFEAVSSVFDLYSRPLTADEILSDIVKGRASHVLPEVMDETMASLELEDILTRMVEDENTLDDDGGGYYSWR